jgi:hypothetical protein
MFILELLPPVTDIFTNVMVNKIERGNVLLFFPMLLAASWLNQVRLYHRQRRWLRLSADEQVRRQSIANMTDRRHEMYPI